MPSIKKKGQAAAWLLLTTAIPAGAITRAATRAVPVSSHPKPAQRKVSYQFEEDPLEATWAWTAHLDAHGPFESRVAFHYRDAGDYLLLDVLGDGAAARLSFFSVRGGVARPLGEPAVTIAAPPGQQVNGQLTLQRSRWRVRALWNGKLVVTAYSAESLGRLGTWTAGAQLTQRRLQPTAPVVFSDDFMRAQAPGQAETSGQWHIARGVWETSGSIDPRADVTLNPNPFVYRARDLSGLGARSSVGRWFWSDYTVTASVRPVRKDAAAPLVAGLCAYRQHDGAAIEGSVDFATGRATLRQGKTVLATGSPFAAAPDQWHRLFLDPGPGTVRLVVDGVERARWSPGEGSNGPAMAQFGQGQAALLARTGNANFIDFDDVRIAPNDAVSDNFAVPAAGRWDDVLGQWQTRATPPSRRVKLSSGPALSLTGTPERADGDVEATFVTRRAQAVGTVFAARDADNYYLARVLPGPQAAQLQLLEIARGVQKLLASATLRALQPGLPLLVQAEWADGVVTARAAGGVAGATVAEVPAGRVGLWADGPAEAVAALSFRALGAAPGWGESALPTRFQKDRLMKNWAANAAAWLPEVDGIRWNSGDFFADAALAVPLPSLPEGGSLTLRLGSSPEAPASGARLSAQSVDGHLQLLLADGNHELDRATVAIPAMETVLRFARRPLTQGHVALRFALGDRVLFSQSVAEDTAPGVKVGIALQSGPAGAPKPPGLKKVPFNMVTARHDGRGFIGVAIAQVDEAMNKQMKLGVSTGIYVQSVVPGAPAALAGVREGDVICGLNDQSVETVSSLVRMIAPLGASRPAAHGQPAGPVGVPLTVWVWRLPPDPYQLDWENATIATTHRLDYTFTNAPVDWESTAGHWDVSERWTCSPQFGFFSGVGAENPTLWSRFALRGDYTIEAYLATPMDQTRGERGPVDLNLTVSGDPRGAGHDLASGYSFLYGANNRSIDRVMRGDAVALDEPFQMPVGSGNTHQDWFYIRLERRLTPAGLHFRYSVNGRTLLDYTDPNPLPGALSPNRLAFWTKDGGISIARVRIWHNGVQGESAEPVEPGPSIASTQLPIPNPLGQWQPRFDGSLITSADLVATDDASRHAVKIVNPQSGGDWTVYVTRRPYAAQTRPRLHFSYRVPAGVCVNLYAKIDERWREIGFTGNLQGTPVDQGTNGSYLGQIAGVRADDSWHEADFDLLGALKQRDLSTRVQALAFAAPDRDYLQAGLGGNHLGATYWIGDFEAPEEATAALVNRGTAQ